MLIRLVGVRLSNLVHGNHQIGICLTIRAETINLFEAIDTIKHKHGVGEAGSRNKPLA